MAKNKKLNNNYLEESVKTILILFVAIAFLGCMDEKDFKSLEKTKKNIVKYETKKHQPKKQNLQKNGTIKKGDCKDISKTARRIFRYKSVEDYDAKIIECCIDEAKVIHLTITLDPTQAMVLEQIGLPSNRIIYILMFEAYFSVAPHFFKKFPNTSILTMYVVEYKKEYDKYGNFVENKKTVNVSMGMTSATAKKVNWDFVKKNIKHDLAFGDWERYPSMFDYMDGNKWASKKL